MQFQSVVAVALAASVVTAQGVSNATVSNSTVAANTTANTTNGTHTSKSKISTGAAIANSMNVGTFGAALAAGVAFLL